MEASKDGKMLLEKLKLLYVSLPSLLKNVAEGKCLEKISDSCKTHRESDQEIVLASTSTISHDVDVEFEDEEEGGLMMETELGCRRLIQLILIHDEAFECIQGNYVDRGLPSMKDWYLKTVKWVSEKFCELNPRHSVYGKMDLVEPMLIEFFKNVGEQFYCYICKYRVKAGGEYPSISCPICHGWFLVEVSPDAPKIPSFFDLNGLIARHYPVTYGSEGQPQIHPPELQEESMHSIDEAIECRICLEHTEEGAVELSCGHTYCDKCIREWFGRQHHHRTCPTCSCLMLTRDLPFNIYLRSLHHRKAQSRSA